MANNSDNHNEMRRESRRDYHGHKSRLWLKVVRWFF